MSLLKKQPEFETMDETVGADQTVVNTEAAQTGKTEPKADAPAASASTAVVEQSTRAVASVGGRKVQAALENLRDALPVDFNTLTQIIASNGNFVDRETKTNLGDTLVFQCLSFQDNFVVDPGDEDAPNDVVKYSNDGVYTTEGVPVAEALAEMHARGYVKARLKQRTVVVGGIISASKTDTYNDTLVQFDLSPKSRVQWDRYRANQQYKLKVGRISAEAIERIKATTEIAQGPDNRAFTIVKFDVAAA